MIKCHTCGQSGHVARDCTWENETSGTARPQWCGECDPRTRLAAHDGYVQRCLNCWAWPAKRTRFNQLLPQHAICGGCGQLVYATDNQPCGKHQTLGIDTHGSRPAHPPLPATAAQARRAIAKETP